jgi:hypothetical protein
LLQPTVVRIANAHGNRRHRLQQAIAADIDFIEADLRYDRGRIWVRHEFRAPLLPLLYNGQVERFHRQGPWALTLRRLFLRLDLAPIAIDELLDTVGDDAGLFLDLKAAPYSSKDASRFIDVLLGLLKNWHHGPVSFCGSWPLLDLVGTASPEHSVYYSVDDDAGWATFAARVGTPAAIRAITIRRDMLDSERASFLQRSGVEYYCWNVETAVEAETAIDRGATGIISHHLDVLAALQRARPSRTEAS